MNDNLVALTIQNPNVQIEERAFDKNTNLVIIIFPKILFDKFSKDELENRFGDQVKNYKDLKGNSLTKL